MTITASELAGRIGATVVGDATTQIAGCATLDEAGPAQLSFLANPKYLSRVADSRAGAIVASRRDARQMQGRTVLVAEDPYFAFRQAMVILHGWRQQPAPGVSPQAWIDETAQIGELCTIRPFAYIAPEAKIGKRCVIYPHCYIGKQARIGDDCILHPGVTVYDHCVLGDRVTLHAGCVIGQDGFGYATAPSEPDAADRSGSGGVIHHKIPQTGNAVIEDDVEMGALCSVDRATLGSTIIGKGTKFSNGVTIGHGTKVGPHNLMVAQVGIAGSVETGAYVVMGGQVGVAGHLTIGDGVQVAAASGVMDDIPARTQVGGVPARPFTHTKRTLLHQQRLPAMAATLKRLKKRIETLEARLGVGDEQP